MSQYGILEKPLTKEQIKWVRNRMDKGCSLRRLATEYVERFREYNDLRDNQILGMDLCAEANYDWQS
jgi:hypothetical protein